MIRLEKYTGGRGRSHALGSIHQKGDHRKDYAREAPDSNRFA